MASILGLFRMLGLAHTRSYLLPLLAVAYFLLATLLPEPVISSEVRKVRARSSDLVSLAVPALMLMSALLPLQSLRWRRAQCPLGAGSVRASTAASLLAHGLFLLAAACLLGMVAIGVLSLKGGFPDSPNSERPLRELLFSGPEVPTLVKTGVQTNPVSVRAPVSKNGSLPVDVTMRPQVVLLTDGPVGGAFRSDGVLEWREGTGSWQRERFQVRQGRPVHLRLQSRSGDPVEFRLSAQSPEKGLAFRPGTIRLTGARHLLLGSLLRAFLWVAISALPLLAITVWLSGFTSNAIAICGAVTVWLGKVAWAWLSGTTLHPARMLADGISIPWSVLGLPAIIAVISCGLAWALAYRDPKGRVTA